MGLDVALAYIFLGNRAVGQILGQLRGCANGAFPRPQRVWSVNGCRSFLNHKLEWQRHVIWSEPVSIDS